MSQLGDLYMCSRDRGHRCGQPKSPSAVFYWSTASRSREISASISNSETEFLTGFPVFDCSMWTRLFSLRLLYSLLIFDGYFLFFRTDWRFLLKNSLIKQFPSSSPLQCSWLIKVLSSPPLHVSAWLRLISRILFQDLLGFYSWAFRTCLTSLLSPHNLLVKPRRVKTNYSFAITISTPEENFEM